MNLLLANDKLTGPLHLTSHLPRRVQGSGAALGWPLHDRSNLSVLNKKFRALSLMGNALFALQSRFKFRAFA